MSGLQKRYYAKLYRIGKLKKKPYSQVWKYKDDIRKMHKLQEFDVEIKEVLSRVQKVKAESLDDAINKAMDMYYAEQIVLGAEDMKGVDFAPISEGQLPSSLKENGGKAR